jgi:DNA repair protein RecN (Recombination protein N)
MLTELRIENFAIIQHLELQLSAGLTTFTGETGAGKSIILDAIEALVGGRTDLNQVRAGAERAILEASFHIPNASRAAILAILEREDLLDDPDYLTLGRELRREGRSSARVNGRSVNVSLLRELGSFLVDIHGQSEHLSLLNVRQHRVLLDDHADLNGLLDSYRESYRQFLALRRELSELRRTEQDSVRRAELLTFQLEEIEAARLQPVEEEILRLERDRLANAENLASLAQQALTLLDEDNSETPSLTDQFGQVVQLLAALNRLDVSQAKLSEGAQAQAETLAELSRDLRSYLERIEFNPRRLEQTEERLELIHSLKRKYGASIEAILAFSIEARHKLEKITNAGERIAELEAEENLLLQRLALQATELSTRRHQNATLLGKAVEGELGDLRMPGARFMVDMRTAPQPEGLSLPDGQKVAFDENGIDQVEFLIAPNPGEGFKPMVKIASGGETSRLMLALKNVLAKADSIPTLIFDEIDQGIGGRVGFVVGEKLWQLGRQHQVLCVTHLPQLAAFGDQQLRVGKLLEEGRTLTQVEMLEDPERREELAWMLGGAGDANRKAAQEILELARQRVKELKR